MNIKILIYNQGLDNKSKYVNDITKDSFDKITSNQIKSKQLNLFACDDSKFTTSYNDIVTSKLVKYIHDKLINVCVLQETCINSVDKFNFSKYIASFNRYVRKDYMCRKLLATGVFGDIKIEIPKFIPYQPISPESTTELQQNKVLLNTSNDYFNVTKISVNNTFLYIINIHNRDPTFTESVLKFVLHLVGTVLSIIKNDEPNSNIII